ncbi:MAG TPA: MgtC/SapB family protein [Geopsychrobacteraceae bacterium]|nr:MgtC/SapB family protein [Geopsychrobacteraceae bacterium]
MEFFDQPQYSYELSILYRLLLAVLLGGLVGMEREIHGRPAGFRTHLLVTVGACLMSVVSEHYYLKYVFLDSSSAVRFDPSRVAAQIVTGIGFLGAGVIIKEGLAVRGLTTAACLWVAAGIGMAIGGGLYLAAIVTTLIALTSLLVLKRLERFFKKDRYRTLTIHAEAGTLDLESMEQALGVHRLRIADYGIELNRELNEVRYDLVIRHPDGALSEELIKTFSGLDQVRRVRFR